MKIATWNIERPNKATKRIPLILHCLKEVDADILVLTETNELIDLGNDYTSYHTANSDEPFYKPGEKRVSIYFKYNSVDQISTFRDNTSICITLETPLGNLAVYGTIIGINGNKRKDFITDLDKQLNDFEKIAGNNNLCIIGDLNISFSDNYYFTETGRQKLNNSFNSLGLINLTAEISENIDHIILPAKYIAEKQVTLNTWNMDKKLSDHIGVSVTLL